MPSPEPPLIALSGVTRAYTLGDQTVQAIAGIDLSIQRGEYCSIMGPSGSGKSTLLNLIALLDRPSSGRYELNGADVTGLSDDQLASVRNRSIGFVFQSFHLVPRLSAAQNIELPLVLAGVAAKPERKVAAMKSRLSRAMKSWLMSFGHAALHSYWLVQLPKTRSSAVLTIASTRRSRSG